MEGRGRGHRDGRVPTSKGRGDEGKERGREGRGMKGKRGR